MTVAWTHCCRSCFISNHWKWCKRKVATVVYKDGSIVSATVSSGGQGYQVGDVLGITTDLGINGRLSVVSIAATSELIIDNVQGDIFNWCWNNSYVWYSMTW